MPSLAPLCSGLARRPLKAVARVRIPSGLPGQLPWSDAGLAKASVVRGVQHPAPHFDSPVSQGAPQDFLQDRHASAESEQRQLHPIP